MHLLSLFIQKGVQNVTMCLNDPFVQGDGIRGRGAGGPLSFPEFPILNKVGLSQSAQSDQGLTAWAPLDMCTFHQPCYQKITKKLHCTFLKTFSLLNLYKVSAAKCLGENMKSFKKGYVSYVSKKLKNQ